MIDLHNHILPGVDDGAADLAESLAIARQLVSEGVERVAATPHLDWSRRSGAGREDVEERVRILQSALDDAGIRLQVMPGHEILLVPETPDLLRDGIAASLGSGGSILVEVPFDQRPLYLEDTIFQLQLAGYQPVLAHPERYGFVQSDVTAVDPLVDRGVALQLTAPALLGEYGGAVRRTAERLLRRGSYTSAASDRHHPGPGRSMATLHDRLCRLADVDLANLLLRTNPARLLNGKQPVRPAPLSQESSPFFVRVLRRGG